MLATGIINPDNRTFDIADILETNTSISIINNKLKLSYTSPTGELIQLSKDLNTGTDNIQISDSLDISPVTENSLGGYAQKTNERGVAKALTTVDWNYMDNLTSKTFTDDNNVSRVAVLLPVVLG